MARAYVSIGSNIGRETNIRSGVRALRERFRNLTLSSVYESRAIGFEGPDFYNLVAGFDVGLGAPDLVDLLHRFEASAGRVRQSPERGFLSRTLDMDLLLYDDLILATGDCELPRGEILEHAFVLAPLAELIPDARHPLVGRSYQDLWAGFQGDDGGLRRASFDWNAA